MDWDDAWNHVGRLEIQIRRLLLRHFGSEAALLDRHSAVGERLVERRVHADDALLDYTQIRDLIDLIEGEWGRGIEAAFSRKKRAITSDLHRIADLRNAPAHSRHQRYGDRALLVGLCSGLLDDLARQESERDPNDDYYPVLLSAVDRFGTPSTNLIKVGGSAPLTAGDPIHFDCTGRDVRGREILWQLSVTLGLFRSEELATASGESVTLHALVPRSAVGERIQFVVSMWVDAEYHRMSKCDASVAWWYEIRPDDF